MAETSYTVLIVGAGPGGLSVAGSLLDAGMSPDEMLIVDRGEVGQAWLDYPADTHLLSESSPKVDDNMIAGVSTSEVFANIPHPNHIMYQKYLQHVVDKKGIPVRTNTTVEKVVFDHINNEYVLTLRNEEVLTAKFLVWAAGMYSNPNENLNMEGCFIHYARMPYMEELSTDEVTVVGSSNGASGVVMELARPGRVVTLVVSREYKIPMPIDCLWKRNMEFIQNIEKEGLVKIVENFRVKRIYKNHDRYYLESEDGNVMTSKEKPIICTGFLPNIDPVKGLVSEVCIDKETFLNLDKSHQSTDRPGLYMAGTIGRLEKDDGFIRHFRNYGPAIVEDIFQKLGREVQQS
jgi:putative flavoprotein involved in K+ transport